MPLSINNIIWFTLRTHDRDARNTSYHNHNVRAGGRAGEGGRAIVMYKLHAKLFQVEYIRISFLCASRAPTNATKENEPICILLKDERSFLQFVLS